MSALPVAELADPAVLSDGGSLSPPGEGPTACLAIRRMKSSVAVISAHRDIDASNAGALAEYTLAHMRHCRRLILDLSGLDFFGIEGFSVLLRISAHCARAPKEWAVIPGAAVSRVLRICDPRGSLPVADTVDAALATFQDQPHSSRHLTAVDGASTGSDPLALAGEPGGGLDHEGVDEGLG